MQTQTTYKTPRFAILATIESVEETLAVMRSDILSGNYAKAQTLRDDIESTLETIGQQIETHTV